MDKGRRDTAERVRDAVGTVKASDDLEQILRAACQGRIDALLVQTQAAAWGEFDATEWRMEVHAAQQPGDEDLLDLAAVQTLYNGGTVYALEGSKMPTAKSIAALFRY